MVSEVTSTTQEIVEAILTGEVDDGHDAIESAIAYRSEAMARVLAAGLESGDRVRLVKIRPQYLCGVEGTVAGRPSEGRVPVKIDDGYHTGRYAQTVRVHFEQVERIEEVA